MPAEVDLRRPWWPIGDQEETGSCVGWALADSVMRWQLVEAGRLAPDEPLSPRFVWMAAKEMRAKLGAVTGDPSWRPGTSLERAYTSLKAGLEVARRFGVALEAEVPWRGGLYDGDVDAFFAGAARRRLRSYWSLDEPDVGGTVDNWREWLNERGPILVKIAVDAPLEAGLARRAGRVRPRLGARPPRRRARRLRRGALPPAQLVGDGLGGRRVRPARRRLRRRRGRGELRRDHLVRLQRPPRCREIRWIQAQPASAKRAATHGSSRSRASSRTRRASAARSGTGARLRSQSPAVRSSHAGAVQASGEPQRRVEVRGRPLGVAGRGGEQARAARQPAPRPTHGSSKHGLTAACSSSRARSSAHLPPVARRPPRGRRGWPGRRASPACGAWRRGRHRGTRRGCGGRRPASPRAHSAAATMASHTGSRGWRAA